MGGGFAWRAGRRTAAGAVFAETLSLSKDPAGGSSRAMVADYKMERRTLAGSALEAGRWRPRWAWLRSLLRRLTRDTARPRLTRTRGDAPGWHRDGIRNVSLPASLEGQQSSRQQPSWSPSSGPRDDTRLAPAARPVGLSTARVGQPLGGSSGDENVLWTRPLDMTGG